MIYNRKILSSQCSCSTLSAIYKLSNGMAKISAFDLWAFGRTSFAMLTTHRRTTIYKRNAHTRTRDTRKRGTVEYTHQNVYRTYIRIYNTMNLRANCALGFALNTCLNRCGCAIRKAIISIWHGIENEAVYNSPT